MIEFRKASFYYGRESKRIAALDNIDITIQEGEFVTVLGANGSGKSTLARLINGLLTPAHGSVLVDSISTADEGEAWQVRQKVGFVFQNPENQIIASTVEEDVAFGPENLGLNPAEIRRRVKESLEAVGMLDYVKHEPHMLSGGQKQRVAIAGALAMGTKYLVLDEATSMLDPRGGKEIGDILHRLNKQQGMTIISVTHIPEEAIAADRAIVLSSGRIVMDGPPRVVFSDAIRLRSYKIALPRAELIADELRKAGIVLPGAILTVDELVDGIC